MPVQAEDVIAAKIACQLKLATPDKVRAALRALDRATHDAQVNLLTDLFSRGALDKAGRARVQKYTRLYHSVRRAALEGTLVRQRELVPAAVLDGALAELERLGYDRRLGELLVSKGELAPAQDRRLADESARALEAEDARVVASYRKSDFEGVSRSITKDRDARLETGQFTVKKMFRSKESQRLARLSQAQLDRDAAQATGSPPPRPGSSDSSSRLPPTQKLAVSSATPAPSSAPDHPSATDAGNFVAGEATAVQAPLDDTFDRFGPYLLLSKLGKGAVAQTHLARRADLARPVALKLGRGALALARFRRAAQGAERVRHEGLVSVLETGERDGVAFLSLEYVAGESLRRIIEKETSLAEPRALALFRDVAQALEAIHAAGLVHGDVRPESVLVATRPIGARTSKLSELALARSLGATGDPASAPDYAAPELAAGEPVDARTDLYALGVVLFEMLVGERPFASATPEGVREQHRSLPPRPLGSSRRDRTFAPALEELVARLLAKDRSQRPPSAARALRALDEVVVRGGEPSRDTARLSARFDELFRG